MPLTPDPPPPDWELVNSVPAEWNDAQALTTHGYNSANSALQDGSGNLYYLFVGKANKAGRVAWRCRKLAESGDAPWAKIPQLTFNVISGGTLNTSTNRVAYNNATYELRLLRDASGVQIAFAAVV